MRIRWTLVLLLAALGLEGIAHGASPPQPTYGTAVVDGQIGEWDTAFPPPPSDFFASMYRAGKDDANHPEESRLYLRYNCATQTMYVLVLTLSGIPAILSPDDAWISIGGVSNKVVNGSSGNNGTPPDFAWVTISNVLRGYEASFTIAPGSYGLQAHLQVTDDGASQTSRTLGGPQEDIPLQITCPEVVFTVTKSADTTVACEGDTVTYTVTVFNAGANAILITAVNDVPFGNVLDTLENTTIQPNQSASAQYQHQVTNTDADPLENTVSVTARRVDSRTPFTLTDSFSVDIIHPAIQVVKSVGASNTGPWTDANTPPGPTFASGSNVYFQYVITNTGDATLTGVTLTDSVYNAGSTPPFAPGVIPPLAAAGTFTYVYGPVTATAGDHNNIATATGSAEGCSDQATDTDPANYFGAAPAIQVVKSVGETNTGPWDDANDPPGPIFSLGADVFFQYVITNTGNVPLTGVTLTDSVYNAGSTPPFAPGAIPSPLAPGATFTYVYGPVTATSGPHTNIATTNGTYNGSTPSDTDPANYLGSAGPPGPEITVVKSVGASNAGPWNDANTSPGPTFAVGANVYFQYVITNTGGVPLTDVTLTDSVFAPLSTPPFAPFPPSPLAPGDSYTYVYGPVTSTSGLHTNVATSTGIYSESQVTDTDPANYTGVTGELTVTKTADTTVSKVGDCICFTITVTNNTGVPVTVTSVGDRLLERDGNSIDAGFTGVYAPGESRSHTYCYTVRPGDPDPLVNTVTVNGTTNTRPQVPITGQASVTVDLVHPGLVVIKRGPASAQVGDVVTYTVTFGNTGDVAMENIQVTDSLAGVFVPAPPTTLAPLTRANVTFTYTVQANDPNPLINIVTVTANPVGLPNVLTATGTATLEVTPAPNPCILVTKTASPSYVCVGDTVTYTMAVRNCGNVPLVGVTLVDSILGTITLPTTTLQPGQAAQVQVPYVVKCSDPSTLGNTATATGYAACSGRRVTSSATARVRILHPLLVVRKTANRAYANPGEAITYTVTITNFGDVAIRGIQVADNLPARFAPPFPTTLNPGASATSTFTYTVRPCDPNPLVNRVTVRGIACYTNCPVTATSSVSTPRSCYVAPPPCPPTYLCYP